jgi:hypothetical protein
MRNRSCAHAGFPHPEISFFESCSHPYYILTQEYAQNSFGLRNYYHLCHILNSAGYEAYVTDGNIVPDLRTPLLTPAIRAEHRRRACHSIAVYGEEINENILDGDVVAWWVMNMKGHVRDERDFGENLVFYHTPEYAVGIEDPDILKLNFVDRRIFNAESVNDGARNGFCWYAHKYFEYQKKPVSEFVRSKGISVCRDVKLNRTELADIFRKSKVLYSYEDSAINCEAQLCGCPVVFVRSPYFDNTDFEKTRPFINEEGIESGYVPHFDCASYLSEYESWENMSWESVARFIDATQKAAAACSARKRALADPSGFAAFCHAHKPLYIYGAGHWGRQCLDVLNSHGIRAEAFVVSDDEYAESKRENPRLPILPASSLESNKRDCGIVVAVSIKAQNDIVSALRERQFGYYRRYPVLVYCPIKPGVERHGERHGFRER